MTTPATPTFCRDPVGRGRRRHIRRDRVSDRPGQRRHRDRLLPHRASAGRHSSWTAITIPAANGGGTITGYATGQSVEIRGRAIGMTGTPSAPTPVITFGVGAGDAPIPAALDASMITVGPLLGGAVVQFSTGADAATKAVQLYRSTSSTLNRSTDAIGDPVAVEPSRSYSLPAGDTTRSNIIVNGNFDSGASWVLGADWTIGGGVASHVAGASSKHRPGCRRAQIRRLVSGRLHAAGRIGRRRDAADLGRLQSIRRHPGCCWRLFPTASRRWAGTTFSGSWRPQASSGPSMKSCSSKRQRPALRPARTISGLNH